VKSIKHSSLNDSAFSEALSSNIQNGTVPNTSNDNNFLDDSNLLSHSFYDLVNYLLYAR
jgi:hypothetical protein